MFEHLVPYLLHVLSFALGVLASFAAWWLTSHHWKPSIRFAPEMAEYSLECGQSLFQCALENSGKRDIIDVEIRVRIGIENFKGASGWAYHMVKSNSSSVPVLSPGKKRKVRVFDTRDEIQFIDQPSKSIREAIVTCESLRDILNLGANGSVRIHVFGYDCFSGARKHFQSPPYRLGDIRKGTFNGLDVIENTRFKHVRTAAASQR